MHRKDLDGFRGRSINVNSRCMSQPKNLTLRVLLHKLHWICDRFGSFCLRLPSNPLAGPGRSGNYLWHNFLSRPQ